MKENINESIYYACGDGWESLILQVEALINKYNIEHPDLDFPVEIFDIKEKWGLLDISLSGNYDKKLYKKVNDICKESEFICENCGTRENVKRENTNGWIRTLCEDCRNKEIEEHQKFFEMCKT